jgi:hypothetical protein
VDTQYDIELVVDKWEELYAQEFRVKGVVH